MDVINENVTALATRVVNALEDSRKIVLSIFILIIVAIFIRGSFEHFEVIKHDIEYLRVSLEFLKLWISFQLNFFIFKTIVNKLHDQNVSSAVTEAAENFQSLFYDTKLKWNSLKNEIHEDMRKVPNVYEVKKERFDFALEGAGGRVISYHDTQLMHNCSTFSKLRGACHEINPPSKAIQDLIQPGEAFCFKGNKGSITIKLACDVEVDSVTIEHIDKALTSNGNFSDAPKEIKLSVG